MKKILFTLSLILVTYFASAQCTPDPAYVSLGVGVYPKPDSLCQVTVMDTCFRNQAYSFVLTAVVPDSITITSPIAGTFPLDWIKITAVSGLPAGISYQCVPATCQFENGTSGCVLLSGTTTDPAGVSNLTVSADVRVGFGLVATTIPYTFPDTSLAPGCYLFVVAEPVGINEAYSQDISCTPNPAQNNATIAFENGSASTATLSIVNLNGQIVKTENFNTQNGQNAYTFDVSDLSNGVYYYTVTAGDLKFLNKIVINK